MSERYTRIFEGESDLYTEGSPVMISAAVLLNDTETGRVIAQMKFRSLSEKKITYLKVRIKPFDMLKNALSTVEFEYTDLSADMYDQFGQKTPVVLPDTSARSYEAAVIGAAFSDGTVWKSSETEWCPDPEREKRIEALAFNNDTEKAAKKSNKIIAVVIPAIIACIVLVVVLPKPKGNNGGDDIITVIAGSDELDEHKNDTEKQAIEVKVGDYVVFGSYEQDNNTSNGKEDIEWLVLAKEDNKALLISKYALDCQKYNTVNKDVTWETCSLRKWLNETFFSAAFRFEEQSSIISSIVTADKNPSYYTSSGNNTTDKVFLLSITEANKYFSLNEARKCAPTNYAVAQGSYMFSSDGNLTEIDGNCCWWLRTPGYDLDRAANVGSDGIIYDYSFFVNYDNIAIRPAIWINLGD